MQHSSWCTPGIVVSPANDKICPRGKQSIGNFNCFVSACFLGVGRKTLKIAHRQQPRRITRNKSSRSPNRNSDVRRQVRLSAQEARNRTSPSRPGPQGDIIVLFENLKMQDKKSVLSFSCCGPEICSSVFQWSGTVFNPPTACEAVSNNLVASHCVKVQC